MERNTNESSESNPNSKDVQSSTVKKTVRSTHKIQCQDEEDYQNDQETSVLAVRESNLNPWNPPTELQFPCPMTGHKHEVSKCKEFFDLSPKDR